VEAGESEVQSHLWIHREFEASAGLHEILPQENKRKNGGSKGGAEKNSKRGRKIKFLIISGHYQSLRTCVKVSVACIMSSSQADA